MEIYSGGKLKQSCESAEIYFFNVAKGKREQKYIQMAEIKTRDY